MLLSLNVSVTKVLQAFDSRDESTSAFETPKRRLHIENSLMDTPPSSSVSQYVALTPSDLVHSTPLRLEVVESTLPSTSAIIDECDLNFGEEDKENNVWKDVGFPKGRKPKSRDVFFNNLAEDFEGKVLNGVEIKKRESIRLKMSKSQALNDSESLAVIHALNAASDQFVGNSTPDPAIRKMMANILRAKLPETFAVKEVIVH